MVEGQSQLRELGALNVDPASGFSLGSEFLQRRRVDGDVVFHPV
jgi:hypothetical protein